MGVKKFDKAQKHYFEEEEKATALMENPFQSTAATTSKSAIVDTADAMDMVVQPVGSQSTALNDENEPTLLRIKANLAATFCSFHFFRIDLPQAAESK